MANKKEQKEQKENNNTGIAPVVCGIVIAIIILVVVALNTVVIRNDCDSPCRGNNDPYMACPDVCVKTEQTLWELLTGKDPRFVGY